jgi:hypothetical protein
VQAFGVSRRDLHSEFRKAGIVADMEQHWKTGAEGQFAVMARYREITSGGGGGAAAAAPPPISGAKLVAAAGGRGMQPAPKSKKPSAKEKTKSSIAKSKKVQSAAPKLRAPQTQPVAGAAPPLITTAPEVLAGQAAADAAAEHTYSTFGESNDTYIARHIKTIQDKGIAFPLTPDEVKYIIERGSHAVTMTDYYDKGWHYLLPAVNHIVRTRDEQLIEKPNVDIDDSGIKYMKWRPPGIAANTEEHTWLDPSWAEYDRDIQTPL